MKLESSTRIAKSFMTKWFQKKKHTKPKELLSSEFDLLVGPIHAFVCFKDAEYPGAKLLKKGFRHCFVIIKTDTGWINFNPTRNLLFASISDCHVDDPYIEMVKKISPDMTIVELVIKNHFSRLVSLQVLTCVTVVRYALGLSFRPFSAATPYQLYKKLITKAHPNILKVREIPAWNQSPLKGPDETQRWQQTKPEPKPLDCDKTQQSSE